MRIQTKFYLLIIFLLIPVHKIIPQNNMTKVLVDITLDQKTSKETGKELTDFIKQELNKSEDIIIVNDKEDFKINVMMFVNRTKKGDTLGYVLSTTFLKPSICEGYKTYTYLTSLLSTARESEFKKTAVDIAASFNEIESNYRKNK